MKVLVVETVILRMSIMFAPTSLELLMILGLAGQVTRVLLQIGEHGLPETQGDYIKILAKLLTGIVGGWIAWELANAPLEAVQTLVPELLEAMLLMSRVLAFSLGFVFPDIAENIIAVYTVWTNRSG